MRVPKIVEQNIVRWTTRSGDWLLETTQEFETKLSRSGGFRCICLLGLLSVAFLLYYYKLSGKCILGRDELLYVKMIERWHENGPETFWQDSSYIPPLLIWSCHMLMYMDVTAVTAGHLLLGASWLLTLPAMYGCGKELFHSYSWALLTLLVTMVFPQLLESSLSILRDTLCCTFFSWFLYLCLQLLNGSWLNMWRWFVTGSISGSALFVRYESLEMSAILAGLVFYTFVKRSDIKRSWRILGAVAGGWVCAIVVWVLATAMPLSFIKYYVLHILHWIW